MKKEDNHIGEITQRLDQLKERFKTFQRLREAGASIDEKIFQNMEVHYTSSLEHLRSLKAYDDFRSYSAWYKKYLNVGDPL